MHRRGKAIALSTVAVGVVVIIATVGMKDRIREEWWLNRLITGSPNECREAAEKLGKFKVVRAVPMLLVALRKANITCWEDGLPFIQPLYAIGKPAVPGLVEAMTEGTPVFQGSLLLTLLGIYEDDPHDNLDLKRDDFVYLHDVAPVLYVLLNAEGERREIRVAAAQALRKLQSR